MRRPELQLRLFAVLDGDADIEKLLKAANLPLRGHDEVVGIEWLSLPPNPIAPSFVITAEEVRARIGDLKVVALRDGHRIWAFDRSDIHGSPIEPIPLKKNNAAIEGGITRQKAAWLPEGSCTFV